MSLPFQTIRSFSQRAANPTRSPKAIVMYSYLIAGFTLPFAIPASRRNSAESERCGHRSELSLHHCCR